MSDKFIARYPEESAIDLPVARVRLRMSWWRRLRMWLMPSNIVRDRLLFAEARIDELLEERAELERKLAAEQDRIARLIVRKSDRPTPARAAPWSCTCRGGTLSWSDALLTHVCSRCGGTRAVPNAEGLDLFVS